MAEQSVLYRRQKNAEIPPALNLRGIKGEELGRWEEVWLRAKLARLKHELALIENELEKRADK